MQTLTHPADSSEIMSFDKEVSKMQFHARSDKGKVREYNEDSCIAKKIGKYTLLVLADGMGGHNGGETASKIAVDRICGLLEKTLTNKMIPGQIMLLLSEAIEYANLSILETSKKDCSLSGMGTTCDICLMTENRAYIAHIGDGRVYKISPSGEILRLTKDHSLVEYMIDIGTITREQAANHPQKNVIMRALGIEKEINPDIFFEDISPGDVFLMGSDGLTNMIEEKELAEQALSGDKPEVITERLINLANEAGGPDNITVIISKH